MTDPKLHVPIFALRDHYDNVMSKNRAALFSSFESYTASLPVRRSNSLGDYLRLVDLPFFVREEDLLMTVRRLEDSEGLENARSIVRYGCGPSGSGKTASMCPAFLLSTKSSPSTSKFSHYLYLAFANNEDKHFELIGTISESDSDAEKQGALFLFQCLKALLEDAQAWRFYVDPTPTDNLPTVAQTAKGIAAYINTVMTEGRLLVHVDEHRKMTTNPGFRRGALSVLALVPRLVVVATYVDVPTEISAMRSSGVCRRAVPIPTIDIEAVLQRAQVFPTQLQSNSQDLTQEVRRTLANIKFRLAAFLTERMSDFHLLYSLNKEGVLDIKNVAKLREVFSALREYIREPNKAKLNLLVQLIKPPSASNSVEVDEKAMEMFLGKNEDSIDLLDRRLHGQIVALSCKEDSVRLFYSFASLLQSSPSPMQSYFEPYASCFHLFNVALTKKTDLLSGTPLERAFLWSLATAASHFGSLRFPNGLRIKFVCKNVEKARIFPKDDIVLDDEVSINIGNLQKGTLYYADECEGGQTSHPMGDIFFVSDDGQLVIIDVTASPYSKITSKRKNSTSFAGIWNASSRRPIDLIMIIVNPLEKKEASKVSETCPQLSYMFGSDAKDMLGGLAQCMAWY